MRSKITYLSLCALMIAFAPVVIIVHGCGNGSSATRATADDPPTFHFPFGVYSPGTLDEVTPANGQAMVESLGMDSFTAYQDYNIKMMREIGISWIRFDFEYNGYGFVQQPDYLDKVRSAGLEVVGCLRPIVDYAPAALSAFESNLRFLVQQYPWIHVWQIGNEPNVLSNQTDDFPRFFVAGSRAVRESCPDCQVMIAGVAARYPTEASALQTYDRVLAEIKRLAPGEKPFDIFDMHYYGAADMEQELLVNIDDYRLMLNKHGFGVDTPIWMTESATYTGKIVAPGDPPAQNEEQQASELVRRFVTGLGAGLGRVSWSRPYENYRYGDVADGFYDNTALVYNGLGQEAARGVAAGTRKMAFRAYQTLVAQVDGFDRVLSVAPGIYEFIFADERVPVFVIWDVGTGPVPDNLLPDAPGGFRVTDIEGRTQIKQTTADIVPGLDPVFVQVAPT